MALHHRLPKMTAAEISWAAGLLIGEGCIGICRSKKSDRSFSYIDLQLSMYDERAIARFAATFGVRPRKQFLKPRNRFIYKVHVRGRTAEKILAAMWPHLNGTDKGDQALRYAAKLGLIEWITGKKRGERVQLQRFHRGRKGAA